MKKLYRVLVIDDDKETISRIANLVDPDTFASKDDVWEIETKSLHVEVIEKIKGEYEISDHCIESLIKVCDKKFDLIIADFGYSHDSSIYDKLPLDDKGEILPQDLKDKVFTPEDLIARVRQYANKKCTGKRKSHLEQNFLGFDGTLIVYSYQDKRFNKVYHTIRERGGLTKNVFPKASFGDIYDIKTELFDTNEQYKSDNHFYAFLKCKFINGVIQNKLKEFIILSFTNSATSKKGAKNSNEKTVSIWEFYKSKRKETNRSILTFILPLIVATIAISCKEWISNRSPLVGSINFQDYFLSVFVLASIVIMLIGTRGFYSDSKKLLTDYKQDKDSVKKLLGKSLDWTLLTLGVGLLFLLVSMSVIIIWPNYISYVLLSFECVSTLVFGIFLFIDIWLMKGAKIARDDSDISKKDKNHFSGAYSFSRDSILFIDSPVLLASLIIFLASLYFEFNSTVVNESRMFHHGFSTGALVVHIIFSQYIFMMLKIKNSYTALNEPEN